MTRLTTFCLTALCACMLSQPSAAVVIDFDVFADGTPVTTIGDVSFGSNIAGYGLVIASGFETTSAPNYLGVDDGGSELFFAGDEIYLDFATPISSISASFIAVAGTPGDTFTLFTPGESVLGSLVPDTIFANGDEVYTLMLALTTPSTLVTLANIGLLTGFNVDDITYQLAGGAVPEPPLMALLGVGLVVLQVFTGRRVRRT